MPELNNSHQRHSIRLKDYDYSQPGGYFITLVTHERRNLFGKIVQGEMQLNEFGVIAHEQWLQIPMRFDLVELGEFVIMPDHIHGILIIHESVAAVEVVESVGAGFTPARINEMTGQPQGLPRRGMDEIGKTEFGQPQGLPRRGTDDIGQSQFGQPQFGQSQFGQPQGLPRRELRRVTLGDIVGAYKSLVANECLKIYKLRNEVMGKLWQRNYYEHIIRSERELNQIGEYILSNPANWDSDGENSECQA